MRVGVIGVGHVGLVTAASMADLGHDVVGMDDDAAKVDLLRSGGLPFLEPGLEELVASGVDSGRLRFTGEAGEVVDGTDVVFICVGTPRRDDGAPNLSYVQAAATAVATHATGPVVVAEKSTVPVQTGERIRQALRLHAQSIGENDHHDVVSNPEFLRESRAVEDTLRPDRIVVGADSEHGHAVMRELYAPLLERHPCPYVATDVRTAELIKHASNAFLATKISFINAVARICELAGADVEVIADAMGHDPRIGRQFLNAGLGYGGSCLVGDETVLARRDGSTEHLTLAEFWARVAATGLEAWEVLAWHPGHRQAGFFRVAAVTARPYRGDLVEVRTRMGRRLRCTPDHPFIVGDGTGGPHRVRLAEQLTTDDRLPLVPTATGADSDRPQAVPALAASGANAPAPSRRSAELDVVDDHHTAWLRVTGLGREPFDGMVYSLEVPDAHTVVTSGGLVTHNCFPKDVEAFIHIAGELGYDFGMLRETDRVNREAKSWPLSQLRRLLWNVAGKEIAVLGLAFKPDTDDVRDAPALEVIDGLVAEGARVRLHDPAALPQVRDRYPDAVLCDKAEDALEGAHAVVVCTEWDEYRAITPERLKDLLQYPVVVDARNVWDPDALAAAGLNVASVGRPLPA